MPATRPVKKHTKPTRRRRIRKAMNSCTEDLRAARELVDEGNRLVATIAPYPFLIWATWHVTATGGESLSKMLVLVKQTLGLG